MNQEQATDDGLLNVERASFLRFCERHGVAPAHVARSLLLQRVAANKPLEERLERPGNDPVATLLSLWRRIADDEHARGIEETAQFISERFHVFTTIAAQFGGSPSGAQHEVIASFRQTMDTVPVLFLCDDAIHAYVRYRQIAHDFMPDAIVFNHVLLGVASNVLAHVFTRAVYVEPKLLSPNDTWVDAAPRAVTHRELVSELATAASHVAHSGLLYHEPLPFQTQQEFVFGLCIYYAIFDFMLFHEISHVALGHDPLNVDSAAELQADRLAASLLWNRRNGWVDLILRSHSPTLLAARAAAPIFLVDFLALHEKLGGTLPTGHRPAVERANYLGRIVHQLLKPTPHAQRQFENFLSRIHRLSADAARLLGHPPADYAAGGSPGQQGPATVSLEQVPGSAGQADPRPQEPSDNTSADPSLSGDIEQLIFGDSSPAWTPERLQVTAIPSAADEQRSDADVSFVMPGDVESAWKIAANPQTNRHMSEPSYVDQTVAGRFRASRTKRVDVAADVSVEFVQAVHYLDLEHFELASEKAHASLRAAERVGDALQCAHVMHLLGRVAERQGKLAEAHDWYGRAEAVYREQRDDEGLAFAWQSLGQIAELRGDLVRAAEWYHAVLPLHEQVGKLKLSAFNHTRMGAKFDNIGNVEMARDLYAVAVRLFIGMSEWVHVGRVATRLGGISCDRLEFPEAADWLITAAEAFHLFDDKEQLADVKADLELVSRHLPEDLARTMAARLKRLRGVDP